MVAADVDVCLNNYTLGGCIYTGQASCQIRVESAGARSICTNWAANLSQTHLEKTGPNSGKENPSGAFGRKTCAEPLANEGECLPEWSTYSGGI